MKTLLLLTLAALAAAAQPAIGITINGAGQARLAPGWPLLISVSVTAGDEPARLALRERPWTDAVTVTVEAPTGATLELHRTGREQPVTAELEGLALVSTEFFLDPEQTAELPTGVYRIRAAYDPGDEAAEDAWARRIEAVAARFEVSQDPPEDEAAAQSERLLLLSYWSEWRGDRDQALASVVELIEAQPRNSSAHLRRADLLEAGGDLSAALRVLDELEVMLREDHPDAPAPMTLHHRQAELLDKLLAATEAPPESPLPPVEP